MRTNLRKLLVNGMVNKGGREKGGEGRGGGATEKSIQASELLMSYAHVHLRQTLSCARRTIIRQEGGIAGK